MAQRHFEGKDHAESYQRYRVSPPQELVDEVLNFLRKRVGYVFKNFCKNDSAFCAYDGVLLVFIEELRIKAVSLFIL